MSKAVSAITFAWLCTATIASADLIFTYDGTLDASSSLDGTPFAVGSPFSISAVFDETTDTDATAGQGLYPASVSVTLPGGTFTAAPGEDLNVAFFDSTVPALGGQTYAAISDSGLTQAFGALFTTATAGFSADAPTTGTTFTGATGDVTTLPFVVTLAGAGDLVVSAATAFGPTAGLTTATAVPEPSQVLLISLVGLALCLRSRQKMSE